MIKVIGIQCEQTIAKAQAIIQQHREGVAHFRKARCGKYTMFSIGLRIRLVYMDKKYYLMRHKVYDQFQKTCRL